MISPALVVALCVMFILTRVHTIRYTFEHLFFFGLRFCVEPSKNQLAQLVTKKGASIASLPVTRVPLTPTFFATEAEIPHLQSFDHLLAILIGYVCGVIFEEVTTCLWPFAFKDSHVWWLAIAAIIFSSSEAIRVCVRLESSVAPLVAGVASSLAALAAIVRNDVAFDAFARAAKQFLENRLDMPSDEAVQFSGRLTLLSQIGVAATAGLLSAACLFPALHFARLDAEMITEQRRDPIARKSDPFALNPRGILAIILVVADYSLPIANFTARIAGFRVVGPSLILLFLASIVRLIATRMRLQLHLDGAVDAFRSFWVERPAIGLIQAGERLRFKVWHKAWTLTAVAFAAIANPVAVLALLLATKRNGGVQLGVCPLSASKQVSDGQIFVREIGVFLATFATGAYMLYSSLAAVYMVVSSLFEGKTPNDGKTVRPLSSSEKRKQRRNMRATWTPTRSTG